MIRPVRVADPTVEPIFLDEALNWASVSVTSLPNGVDLRSRDIVRDLIPEQREAVETFTGRVLVGTDFVVTVDEEDIGGRHYLAVQPYLVGQMDLADCREERGFWIPLSPISSVSKIEATDPNGNVSVVDPTVYSLIGGEYPRIVLNPGQVWPSPLRREASLAVYCHGGYADPIGPLQQASVDDEAVLTGSEVAIADIGSPLRLGFEVTAGGAVAWAIYGSDDAFVTEAIVRAAATVQSGAADHALIVPAFKYYRVKVKSATSGTAGTGVLTGLGGAIPGPLRLAVRELVRYHFDHRGNQLYIGAGGFKGVAPSPKAIFDKIYSYRVVTVQ